MGSTTYHSSDYQDPLEVDPTKVLHVSDGLNYQQMDGFRVVERLGGGAMATVYRAIDARNHQPVALKVLAPGADDTLRERFRVEARTVSVLSHPHIVRTLQVGECKTVFPTLQWSW
ncbi:MAG: protein kinase [Caldilineaceae bacterium]